ncbi:hypothetical protein, partial [Paracraurococcus ruber]|uniref:hypothetical protein n=1 Tax=Paracraurococcus ruber TaxID=77675 RepID=UPI0038D1846C
QALAARLAARGQAPEDPPAAPADADPVAQRIWQGTGEEVAAVRAGATYAAWRGGQAPVADPAPGAAPGLLADLALAQARQALAEERAATYAARLAEHADLLLTQRSHMRFLTSSLARLTAPASAAAASTAQAAATQAATTAAA